ncbi:MAG: NAD-dependent epimerase/dehydratase family protein [Myxococcales bacterium]|nr:NAD-dependent epimerase/dehydratase family protein [Myxococcales bacterium]
MQILVTGGAGFIGSHTVDRLVEGGHCVRVLDALTSPVHRAGVPDYLNPNAEFLQGDVTRREDLLPALGGIDAVFHFAAYQDYLPDFSRFFQVNAAGTALLYELIVEHDLPVRKVVVASSQSVGGEGLHRCPEGHVGVPDMRSEERLRKGRFELLCPTCGAETTWQPSDESIANPQNPYGLSKHAEERIALSLGDRYDIPSVAMRYSIVQGPRQSPHNAYSGACRVFCLSFLSDREPPIYEDGHQVRDFVNIHDVVDANLLVLEDARADGRVFNVGGGRAYTVAEFAGIVASIFGKAYEPRPDGRYRFGDTRHVFSDCTALRSLGWEPKRDAVASVSEYLVWLRDQDDLSGVLDRAEQQMRGLGVVREVMS